MFSNNDNFKNIIDKETVKKKLYAQHESDYFAFSDFASIHKDLYYNFLLDYVKSIQEHIKNIQENVN